MLSDLAKPFGLLLMWLYELTSNYGLAIILFGLVVKLILLPFQVKSKKSMMRMNRLQPQVKELEKKYAGDQNKYSMEVNKLYRENRINPMSGCLWSLLPFPILLALYQAIRFPLTIMMGVPNALLEEGGAIAEKLASMNFTTNLSTAYSQIAQSQFISENFSSFAGISSKLRAVDFTFLGLDLTQQPRPFFFMNTDWSTPAVWGQAFALFLMPIIAMGITYISSKLASATNTPSTQNGKPVEDDPTASTMKGMTMMMPLMTLVFGFMMPASMCLYWIVSMGLGAIQDAILNRSIKKQLAGEEAEYRERWAEKEAKLEAKRRETERLRAENATSQNRSTSKSKVQKLQKEAQKAKETQWELENNLISDTASENPSKIGNRTYARGRNYDPDRYNRD